MKCTQVRYSLGDELISQGPMKLSSLHAAGEPIILAGRNYIVTKVVVCVDVQFVQVGRAAAACGRCGGTKGSTMNCVCEEGCL